MGTHPQEADVATGADPPSLYTPISQLRSQVPGFRTQDPGPRSQAPHRDKPRDQNVSLSFGRWAEDGGRSFSAFGTWVGHFFINFHGGTRTMPRPSRSPIRFALRCRGSRNVGAAKAKKVSPARTKVVGVFCANERRWRRRSCPVSVYLGICAAIYIHIYIYSYSCVCGLITFCLGARPSRPTEFPSPTPGPPFKKGLLKAKTHFYVCSSARLAVPYAPPLLLRPVSRTRSPFLPKVGPEDVCQAGTIVPAQPHRSLVLEKLQFSPRKKAKTSSWSRFDMARDQLPRRSNEFPSRQLGSIPGKGKIRDEK